MSLNLIELSELTCFLLLILTAIRTYSRRGNHFQRTRIQGTSVSTDRRIKENDISIQLKKIIIHKPETSTHKKKKQKKPRKLQ